MGNIYNKPIPKIARTASVLSRGILRSKSVLIGSIKDGKVVKYIDHRGGKLSILCSILGIALDYLHEQPSGIKEDIGPPRFQSFRRVFPSPCLFRRESSVLGQESSEK